MKMNWNNTYSVWQACGLAMLCLAVTIMPGIANAADMGTVMCAAANMVTGEIASGLATIGVCTLGAGACFGKISWPMAIGVGVGICGLFGAFRIAQQISQINLSSC